MSEKITLDRGDLGRLERGAAKGEAAGKSIGKAAADATRFASNLLNRLSRASQFAKRFAEGTEFEAGVQRTADVAESAAAGARSLGAIVPGAGVALGAALGTALGSQLVEKRQETERARVAAENEAFRRAQRLDEEERSSLERETARKAELREQRRREREGALGDGDPATVARLRAAFLGRKG